MGVFRVLNTANGRYFIGSSPDLPGMLNRVRFQLGNGSFPNRALQEDWKTCGPDAFRFEALDTLEPPKEPGYDSREDLRTLLDMWMKKLAATEGPGYHGSSRPQD
ncbi:MAG: GIY-YIG nuclease family protein [Candidatus Eisenbacteria bacterium]|nr:GIY-YIG nuclease family protein [Candidatus Eisenbacteria bacterium]